MAEHRESLRAALQKVRRRLYWVGGASGILWAVAAAVVLLLVGAWLDLVWELSPQLRIATLLASGLASLVLVSILLGRILRAGKDDRLARRLDRAAGSGGEILTGVELDGPIHEAYRSHAFDLSAGLAHMAVGRAADLALQVPGAKAIPARPLGRSLGMLAVTLAVIGLLAICLPGLAGTQWNRFLHPFSDIPPYSSIEFQVEPGDHDVVYGDPLDIYVTPIGGAVERIELVLGGGESSQEVLPMFLEPDGRWRAALARVTEPTVYFVRAYRARSPQYRIGVITVPRIENVRFRIEPPAYTRQGPYQGPLPKGGVAGLPGTKVQVWAESNRPLSGGTLSLTGPAGLVQQPLKPTSDSAREVTGEFAVARDGKFHLNVRDTEGQESRESFAGAITLLADERPFIRILQPQPVSLATPNAVLPVVLSAEDDYGISRVQLFRSLNESRPMPMDVRLASQTPRRMRETIQLPLAEYGLSPGDTIKLFGRVEDNDPIGAKGAESSLVTVRIISQEEFEHMLRVRQGLEVLASKYREAQRRAEGLAKEVEGLRKKLENLPPKSSAAKETREEMKRLVERLRKESEAIRNSADRQLPYDLDRNLSEHLKQLARELESGANLLDELDKAPDLQNQLLAEQLRKLAEKLQRDRGQFGKEAMQPIEHLAALFPLMADAAKFIELAARQQDLADRMASLKGRDRQDDPALKARMRDLEEEQRQIREELASLLGDIENHTAQLPDDPKLDKLRTSAAKFVKDVRASGASEAMSQAESSLAEFGGTRAHEKAKEAAEILAKFVKICDGSEQDGFGAECLAFQPTLGKGLGDTIGQLMREMGLGNGPGGSGTRPGMSGYSARRGGNVGLYGSLPGMGAGQQGEGRQGRGDTADSTADASGGSNPDSPTQSDLPEAGRTGATGGAAVPTQYRRRVGQYFQRVAEEAAKK